MSAHVYEAEKIPRYREREYATHLFPSQLAEGVRGRKRLRVRQRPLLTRLWAARPHIRVRDRRPAQQAPTAAATGRSSQEMGS